LKLIAEEKINLQTFLMEKLHFMSKAYKSYLLYITQLYSYAYKPNSKDICALYMQKCPVQPTETANTWNPCMSFGKDWEVPNTAVLSYVNLPFVSNASMAVVDVAWNSQLGHKCCLEAIISCRGHLESVMWKTECAGLH
jgi:hypothetical protein